MYSPRPKSAPAIAPTYHPVQLTGAAIGAFNTGALATIGPPATASGAN
jgi:hypothetical protein